MRGSAGSHAWSTSSSSADDAEHRRGINPFAESLVVEADVAAGDGISSSSQALVMPSITCENCHMMCGFSGLPKFRQLVAPTGVAPATGDVARGFGDRVHRAELGIEIAPAPVAVERHGQSAIRALDANHAGIAARALRRPSVARRSYCSVIQRLRADVGLASRRSRAAVRSLLFAELDVLRLFAIDTGGSQRSSGRLYSGASSVSAGVGNFGDDLAVLEHAHLVFAGDAADGRRRPVPTSGRRRRLLLRGPFRRPAACAPATR